METVIKKTLINKEERNSTVMIVDDSFGDLRLMVEALKELRFRKFILANNGAIALAQSRVSHPDIIIVDLHLPDMTGTLLAHAFREIYGAGVRVVCITGMRRSPFLDRLNFEKDDSGVFDRIIEKSFDYKSLQTVVQGLF